MLTHPRIFFVSIAAIFAQPALADSVVRISHYDSQRQFRSERLLHCGGSPCSTIMELASDQSTQSVGFVVVFRERAAELSIHTKPTDPYLDFYAGYVAVPLDRGGYGQKVFAVVEQAAGSRRDRVAPALTHSVLRVPARFFGTIEIDISPK